MPSLDPIYTILGDRKAALAQLERRLALDGRFSVHDLRLDPTWDPLRDDPRFEDLLARYPVESRRRPKTG